MTEQEREPDQEHDDDNAEPCDCPHLDECEYHFGEEHEDSAQQALLDSTFTICAAIMIMVITACLGTRLITWTCFTIADQVEAHL